MAGPDSNTSADLMVTGSTAGFNLMQGSLGTLIGPVNSHGAAYGVAGEATIDGGNAGDDIFDTGGVTADNLSLASTGDDAIFYAQFSLNNTSHGNALIIDNDNGEYGFGPGFANPFDNGLATVTNFNTSTAAGDYVDFNTASWGSGSGSHYGVGTYEGITTSNFGTPTTGPAVFWTIAAGGSLPALNSSGHAIDVIVFDPNDAYGSDGALATAINGGVVGFTAANHFTNTSTILFAFNNGDGTTIADVQFHNAGTNTAVHVDHVQDLVDLVGVTTTALQPANVHFN